MRPISLLRNEARQTTATRSGFFSSLIGLELTIVLLVLVALGAALVAGSEERRAAATQQPNKMRPVRRIATAGAGGSHLIVLTDACCFIRDLVRFETFVVWMQAEDERVNAVAGSSVDERLLLCRNKGHLDLLNVETAKRVWHATLPTESGIAAAFSPDGTNLAIATDKARILLVASETGRVLHTIDVVEAAHTVCFTPCGQRIVAPIGRADIGVWDAVNGLEVARFSVDREVVTSVSMHPSGQSLVVGTYDGMTLLIDLAAGTIKQKWQVSSLPVMNVAFAPNGKEIVSAGCDGKVTIFTAKSDVPLRSFRAHSDAVRTVAFAGEYLLTGGYDGLVRVWESTSGRKVPFEL